MRVSCGVCKTVGSAYVGSGRGLIVSHPVAPGAECACAAGDAIYVPKMIMGSCPAVVAWAARRAQFRRTELQQTTLRHARAGHRVEGRRCAASTSASSSSWCHLRSTRVGGPHGRNRASLPARAGGDRGEAVDDPARVSAVADRPALLAQPWSAISLAPGGTYGRTGIRWSSLLPAYAAKTSAGGMPDPLQLAMIGRDCGTSPGTPSRRVRAAGDVRDAGALGRDAAMEGLISSTAAPTEATPDPVVLPLAGRAPRGPDDLTGRGRNCSVTVSSRPGTSARGGLVD